LVALLIIVIICGCVKVEQGAEKVNESILNESRGSIESKLELEISIRADRFGFVGMEFVPNEDLGFGWSRPHPGPFIWNTIEPEKGKFDFSEADEIVKLAQAHNISILATIWPYATWDQEKWGNIDRFVKETIFFQLPKSRYKPYDIGEYKLFVKALVERYDGDGINDMSGLEKPIKYWEVLNEPDTSIFGENLAFFKGNAKDYFEILKATYEAVKEADPEATVINGGTIPIPRDKEGNVLNEFIEFWDQVLELGGGNYIDVFNIHSFSIPEDVDVMKKLLEKHGINKPIWVTEFTVKEENEEKKAETIVTSCTVGFWKGVEKVFYTAYIEFPKAPEDLKLGSLIDKEGNPKKAYYAFKTFALLVGNFEKVEKIEENAYKFKVEDLDVYILWNYSKIPKIKGKVLKVNLTGNSTLINASELKPSDKPFYVVLGDEKKLYNLKLKLEQVGKSSPPEIIKAILEKLGKE